MNPNLEDVRESIRKFNDILPYCAQDFIVRNCFDRDSDDWDERCTILSTRVEALASAFRATRAGTPARHELASGAFGKYYWNLVDFKKENLRSLSEHNTPLFSEALDEVGHSINRREGVFVSKLLHWSFPCAFPMMDGRSYNTVRSHSRERLPEWRMARQHERYGYVVKFYVSLQDTLGEDALMELERYDQETQRGLKSSNTWIRVVDKWLWLEGKHG
jgi:hypothetical protein